MGDEAEAAINRMMNVPRAISEAGRTQAEQQALKAVLLAQKRAGIDEGYQKGRASARSQLLMQFAEWLELDPVWVAHVATTDFECGCVVGADYDREITFDPCKAFFEASQEQKAKLFQNVYGYSYAIYEQKLEQARRAQTELQRKHEEEQARLRRLHEEERVRESGINPELLP